jgi:diacylglycerol kinase family enzyme
VWGQRSDGTRIVIVRPFIVMNPRSGGGKVQRFDLRARAERLGASVLMLEEREEDLAARLFHAVDDGADLLGVAGGDGTLALVAGVAAERNVPFLVIPAGTRNHFAHDLGLDPAHPEKALDALRDGADLVIDLGAANGRPFVNNVSFGAYAEIVERPDYREHKLRVTLSVLPNVVSGGEQRHFTVRAGAVAVTDPTAALVSNNPYGTRGVAGIAGRPRLDSGTLGLICVQAAPPPDNPVAIGRGRHPPAPATVTTAAEVVVEAPQRTISVAIDGESSSLETPVHCLVRAAALRVRVPRERPALSPSPGRASRAGPFSSSSLHMRS